MSKIDAEFHKKLVATFQVEATEHLQFLAKALAKLESDSVLANEQDESTTLVHNNKTLIEDIYRRFHSLKGAANAVGFQQIVNTCQVSEDTLAQIKDGQLALTSNIVDELYRAVANMTPEIAPQKKSPTLSPNSVESSEVSNTSEKVHVSRAKLEQLLYQVEELIPIKYAAELQAIEIAQLALGDCQLNRSKSTLQQQNSPQAASNLTKLHTNIVNNYRLLQAVVEPLLGQVRELMLQPFSEVTDLMLPAIKALAKEQDKTIDFVVSGADTEVDRRVLSSLHDPLLHLVRNAVDHGIETRSERQKSGKAMRAKIELLIESISDSEVKITLADDGAGIDAQNVIKAASELGVDSVLESDDDRATLLQMVFNSGLSTATQTTTVSGRGLGLAIVREKVEKLNGSVTVESEPQLGTSFNIIVPLTLSSLRAIMICCNQKVFAFPNFRVKQAIRVEAKSLHTCQGRHSIKWSGESIAVLKLQYLLGLANNTPELDDATGYLAILVVEAMGEKLAIVVDDILGEQEVLVKSLGPQLVRVRNVVGSTLLPSGELGIILNVADLLITAKQGKGPKAGSFQPTKVNNEGKRILIAEDSLTALTQLQQILETAGYQVGTASNGAVALDSLRTTHYDLLISDIEMPQLTGYELTCQIRRDKTQADLPIILVTSLNSSKDKERGLEAGANAYLVKGDFDEALLLKTVGSLI